MAEQKRAFAYLSAPEGNKIPSLLVHDEQAALGCLFPDMQLPIYLFRVRNWREFDGSLHCKVGERRPGV
jgi:hypothetical protein